MAARFQWVYQVFDGKLYTIQQVRKEEKIQPTHHLLKGGIVLGCHVHNVGATRELGVAGHCLPREESGYPGRGAGAGSLHHHHAGGGLTHHSSGMQISKIHS